jgi:hypothetical protein
MKRYEQKQWFQDSCNTFTRIKNVAYQNLQDMLGFAHKIKE